MSRRWKDPRDGSLWLIDAMPFDFGPSAEEERSSLMGWTLVFASRQGDHRRLPVGYDLGANLSALGDRELIALLEAAALRD
jgi:hypothetical protein